MHFKIIRYFAYLLEIIIFYIIGETPHLIPSIYGVKPTLIIPIVFIIALFEGEKVGLVFGIFIGILLDTSFYYGIGFYTIVMSICGYIVGLTARRVVKSNLSTAMIISVVSIFFIYSLHFVIFYLINNYGYNSYAFVFHYLPSMAYTLILTPLIYFFNRSFALNIRKKPDKIEATDF